MNTHWKVSIVAAILLAAGMTNTVRRARADVPLPKGVEAVWDLDKAHHETTPTCERISINGLWRWQPADAKSDRVPGDDWGYFEVPG